MIAIVETVKNLQNKANVVNSGRTDGTYFYVNNNCVTVSNPHLKLSDEQQESSLAWFLSDIKYRLDCELITD